MKIYPEMIQQSEEWFTIRAGRVTASYASQILTPKGKRSDGWESYAMALCYQSINKHHIPSFPGNRHTERGNECEPYAREMFENRMRPFGMELRTVGFVTREDAHGVEIVGCSPDAFVVRGGEIIAGFETKAPEGPKHCLHLVAGVLPDDHKPQVHFSMAITGLPWYFMSYEHAVEPLIVPVEPDKYTALMTEAIDEFICYYAECRRKWIPILTGKEAA